VTAAVCDARAHYSVFRLQDDSVSRESSVSVRTRSRDVTRGNGGSFGRGPWRAMRGALVGRRVYSIACQDVRISKRGLSYKGTRIKAENARALW